MNPTRKPVPCATCSGSTTARSGICRPCTFAAARDVDEMELRGGSWVPVDGIMRWRAEDVA